MSELWNHFFVWPIINLLIAFYKLFSSVGIPGSLGFAVIALTALVKLILFPFAHAQVRSTRKMQAIKPHLDAAKEKHKNDAMRQQQEMSRIYKEHGVNPASGCVPSLIQFPVIIALYNALSHIVSVGNPAQITKEINSIVYFPFLHLDKTLDTTFFGLPLAQTPAHWQQIGIFILIVPVITALLQYFQNKIMMPSMMPQAPVQKNAKASDADEFASIMQKQMMYFFPIMIGFFSYSFPIGLSIYWNAFSVFGIIQQYIINKQHEKEEKHDTKRNK